MLQWVMCSWWNTSPSQRRSGSTIVCGLVTISDLVASRLMRVFQTSRSEFHLISSHTAWRDRFAFVLHSCCFSVHIEQPRGTRKARRTNDFRVLGAPWEAWAYGPAYKRASSASHERTTARGVSNARAAAEESKCMRATHGPACHRCRDVGDNTDQGPAACCSSC